VEKIWLKHYPRDVPSEIDINEYASVREVFEESVAKFGERPSYTCMGKTLTFNDLDALSAAFGSFLQDNGCGKGTRVALMMPNILQYPVCLFGILRAGCTVVNVNPLYTARELEHQLADSGAELLVVVENFAHVVQEVVGRTKVRRVIVTTIGELLGFKGIAVDLVIRHLKKMVPKFSLPDSISSPTRSRTGGDGRSSGSGSVTTTSHSCNTPEERPASRRAPCCSTAISWPTCCRRARGSGRSSVTSAK